MPSTIILELDLTPAAESGAARNILIAVHGYEPDGWTHGLRAVVPRTGLIRVLVVEEEAAPAFTSLLPAASRRYGAARAAWERERDERHRAVVEAIVPGRPASADVLRIPACADPGRTIAAHASDWPADIVVVGRDRRSRVERALLGPVHERVVERAPCAVLVVQGGARLRAPHDSPGARLPWRAPARGGA